MWSTVCVHNVVNKADLRLSSGLSEIETLYSYYKYKTFKNHIMRHRCERLESCALKTSRYSTWSLGSVQYTLPYTPSQCTYPLKNIKKFVPLMHMYEGAPNTPLHWQLQVCAL